MIWIGIGILIIALAVYLYSKRPAETASESLEEPTPPISGVLLYSTGVAFIGLAIWSLVQLVDNANGAGQVVLYLGLLVAGVWLAKVTLKFAVEAPERHFKNMENYRKRKAEHVVLKQQEVALENARWNANHEQVLRDQQTLTKITEEQVNRTRLHVSEQEAILRSEMIPVARQAGLGVDYVYDVNKHKYLKQIDLRTRWEETEQDLAAADMADSGQQRQVLAERRNELEGMIRERSRVNKEETDEYVKRKLLERYDKGIENLEAEIDSREARLVLPKVTQENRRLT